jgi:hypothetical protein
MMSILAGKRLFQDRRGIRVVTPAEAVKRENVKRENVKREESRCLLTFHVFTFHFRSAYRTHELPTTGYLVSSSSRT